MKVLLQIHHRAVWIEDGVSRAEGPVKEVLEAYNGYLKGRKG